MKKVLLFFLLAVILFTSAIYGFQQDLEIHHFAPGDENFIQQI